MAGFALVHGAGDVGWSWHLVEAELRARGHVTLAPDLPAGDDALTLVDYRDAVLAAVATVTPAPRRWVVVGHSFGAFTAPLVAERLREAASVALVLVAAMVPTPGEAPDDWWEQVGYAEAAEQAARAGEGADPDDPVATFYADVPLPLAREALGRGRAHPSAAAGRAPFTASTWPPPEVVAVVCSRDRLLPPALQRRLARERLGVAPVEVEAGHCAALARPVELAEILEAVALRRPPAG